MSPDCHATCGGLTIGIEPTPAFGWLRFARSVGTENCIQASPDAISAPNRLRLIPHAGKLYIYFYNITILALGSFSQGESDLDISGFMWRAG